MRNRMVRLGLGALILAGLVAAVVLIRTEPVAGFTQKDKDPTVRAVIRIASSRPSIIFDTKETEADFNTYRETQVGLMKSRLVLDSALHDPKIAQMDILKRQEDPAGWLAENLVITWPERSMLVTISMKSGTPKDQAMLINAVADAYMMDVVEREFQDRLRRLQYLEKLYDQYQDDLKNSRANLRDLAARDGSGGGVTELRKQLLVEGLSLREKALLEIRLKQVETQVLADRRKDQPEAAALQDQLAVLAAQREALEHDRDRILDDVQLREQRVIDLQTERDRMDLTAKTAEKVGKEVQALKVELNAPKRVQLIDKAVAPPER